MRSSSQTRISQAPNARPSFKSSTATPLRTPARTPNRSDRNTFIPSTAEKEKAPVDDKEYIHAKSNKIIAELSTVDGFNDFVNKGFKSMTIKQFIGILQHFLQPIVGATPNDFNATYVDCVHQWLAQLDYPYSISKSSLKTPNAPHCLNSIIVLLGWLQDFSGMEQEPMQCLTSEEIPNDDMAKEIMIKTGDMFTIWNNGQIEMEQCIDTITEMYRREHDGATHLTVNIDTLQEEIRQLSITNDENKKVEMELNGHFKIVQDLQNKVESSMEELELKTNAERAARDELKRLQSQLSNQRITMDVRHQLLLEIAQMKGAISSKNNAIMELREASSDKEVLISNLISKKYHLVDRLNNMIYKLSSDLEIAGIANNFNPLEYTIKLTKDDANLDQMLDHLSSGLRSMKERNLKIFSVIRDKGIALRAEFNKLSTDNEHCQSKLNQIQGIVEQLTQDEQNIEMMYKSYVHNTQTEHQNYIERIGRTERDIEERTKGIDQMAQHLKDLKEKRTAFNAKAIGECERLYEERKHEIESRREYLKVNMARINEYHKNKQPLPDHLQKTLDRVLKKRAEKENQENSSKS